MATQSNPYGLSFYNYKGGKNKFSTSTYALPSGYAISLGQGDPVNIAANGNIAAYAAPTGANPVQTLGQFVSVTYINASGLLVNSNYWPANTVTQNNVPAIVTVADLPYNVYKVQCNTFFPLVSPVTPVFRNYNLLPSNPNPQTGQSTIALNTTEVAAPNAYLTVKIVGLAPVSNNDSNSWYTGFPDVLVVINNHGFKIGTNGTNV
jgi:hypothetical protein